MKDNKKKLIAESATYNFFFYVFNYLKKYVVKCIFIFKDSGLTLTRISNSKQL